MNAWWSWILTAVGVFGLYPAGRKSPWGWAVGIGAQVLWFAYAVTTRQYGFVASCLAYGAVYVRNFRAWRAQPVEVPDGAVCPAYRPPTDPADSGLCAGCGMYDYKHRESSDA